VEIRPAEPICSTWIDGEADTTKLIVANVPRNVKIWDILLHLDPKGKNTQQDILQLIDTFRGACPELI